MSTQLWDTLMPSPRLLPRSQKTELQNLRGRLFPGDINRFSQLASSQVQTQTPMARTQELRDPNSQHLGYTRNPHWPNPKCSSCS